MIRHSLARFAFVLASATALFSAVSASAASDPAAIVKTYVTIGHAKFEDSLTAARTLDAAIDALIAAPSDETLAAARAGARSGPAGASARSYAGPDRYRAGVIRPAAGR